MSTFGDRLRIARKNKNITQRNLAKLINVKFTSISEWENGHHKPDLKKLEDLCNILEVKASWLLSSEGPKVNEGISAYLHGDLDELSEDDKRQINDFIEFIKAKHKKN